MADIRVPSVKMKARSRTRGSSNTKVACLTCRKRKVKCDGGDPCSNCTRRHEECKRGSEERRGTKGGKAQALHQEVQSLKGQVEQLKRELGNGEPTPEFPVQGEAFCAAYFSYANLIVPMVPAELFVKIQRHIGGHDGSALSINSVVHRGLLFGVLGVGARGSGSLKQAERLMGAARDCVARVFDDASSELVSALLLLAYHAYGADQMPQAASYVALAAQHCRSLGPEMRCGKILKSCCEFMEPLIRSSAEPNLKTAIPFGDPPDGGTSIGDDISVQGGEVLALSRFFDLMSKVTIYLCMANTESLAPVDPHLEEMERISSNVSGLTEWASIALAIIASGYRAWRHARGGDVGHAIAYSERVVTLVGQNQAIMAMHSIPFVVPLFKNCAGLCRVTSQDHLVGPLCSALRDCTAIWPVANAALRELLHGSFARKMALGDANGAITEAQFSNEFHASSHGSTYGSILPAGLGNPPTDGGLYNLVSSEAADAILPHFASPAYGVPPRAKPGRPGTSAQAEDPAGLFASPFMSVFFDSDFFEDG